MRPPPTRTNEPAWIVVSCNWPKANNWSVHSVDFCVEPNDGQGPMPYILLTEGIDREEADRVCAELNRCGADPRRMAGADCTLPVFPPPTATEQARRRFVTCASRLIRSRTADHFDDDGHNQPTVSLDALVNAEAAMSDLVDAVADEVVRDPPSDIAGNAKRCGICGSENPSERRTLNERGDVVDPFLGNPGRTGPCDAEFHDTK